MRSYLLFTAFTLLALWSKSTTYYVNDGSTTGDVYTTAIGNNANPGTSTQPFATLTFALTVATGSDIIIVDAGNYSDKDMVISSTQSGITIKGASITSTVFDGTPHTGIYNFMTLTGTNIHIESMTVTEYDNAGAIDITASSALDSSRIYFKDIYFYRNETFTSFDSNPQGGALWISTSGANIPAAVYCDNCHFGDNLAEQGSGGGAIFITGKSTLIVKDSRFSCNNSRGILTTYEGGAIFFNQAHGKLRNTFISGSKVIDQQGGAIRTLNNTATTYNLDIYACTFTNNDARQGAGVYVEGKYTCTITNSLFYGNNITSGFGDGGTINCTNNGANQPTISIINSTIANNNVVSGGDGAGLSNESAASYTVFNSIIWGNANFNVNATSTITATYCDIQPVGDMHTGVLGNINTNPLFTGGTDFTLQGTSPAINSGLLAGSPAKDLTGTNRSGNPDMGCFESGSINPTTSLVCTLFMNCSNPVITSSAPNLSICTGSTFSTSLVSSPVGATYVWSSPSVTGITGHSNNGTGNISEVLVNSTSAPLNVVYTITPYQGACIGTQISYTVTVNPQPTITSSAPVTSICSNTVFSTSLTSNTSSGITSYSWTSSAVAGITGHSTSGTGNISETLVNTTNGALNVSYTITPSVGSCNGTPVTYTVTVNPVSAVTSAAPVTSICSNTVFSTSLSANTSAGSTTYAWTSSAVTGITGHSTSGTGNISETLVNTTNGALNVSYTITPSFGSCAGTPITYTVTVNPVSTVTSAAPATSICSNTLFSTSLSANTSAGSTTYAWTSSAVTGITGHSTSGTGNISETLVNTTNGALNVSYTITPSFGGCAGTPVTYTVTVNPVSTVTSAAPVTSICSNTVFSTSLSTNTSAGSTTYAWTSSAVTGITGHSTSGTGNISETLVNTTNGALNVSYTITPSFGGCTGTPVTYTVTVNPVSAVTSAAPATSICSNTLFSTSLSANTSAGSTTYAWTSSAVTGITGHSTSGTGNISETLVNTTNGPLNVSYTITPSFGGCAGTPITYTVTVNPVSTVTSAAPVTSICSNTLFSTSLSANTSTGSTTYAWTSSAVGGITGHSTSGTGNISETLVNTTNAPLNVSYTITPSFGGCAGTPITYTVTVNPSSAITSTAPATTICSNSDFITNFTSNTASGSTTYSWTSPAVSGITGHSTNGTGNISEILINTTNGPLVVTYTITPSFGVCAGTPTVYSVTVNPVSVITSTAPATSICSNTLFSTSLSANTSAGSTTYAWTSSAVGGITGHATSGTGNISETLVNTTNAPINVSYTIIPSYETCPGTPVTYTVTVNPVATITSSAPVSSICSNTTFSTSLSANTSVGSTTYAWTSLAVTGITGHATSGTGNISETLVNTTNAPLVVTYTITPSFLTCSGTPTVYSVTVEPVATITSTAPASIICSGDIFATSFTSNTSAGSTSYSWTSSAVSGITGHATSGSGNISETLVNTTTGPLTVTYTILPSFNGCAGTPISYSVTVDMIQITMGATQEINCTNSTVTISGSSSTSGVDFSWTNSLGAPAGTTPTNSSTVVNAGGTYTLTITNPISGCSVTGTVDVTVSSSVPDISMGADQELNCLVSTVTITGSTTVTNASFAWTDASSNAAGTTPNASSTDVSTAGIYTLTVTDLDNGCSITGNVNVTLNADPIAVAGNDTTLTCLVTAIVLDGSGSSNGPSFSYAWSGPSIVSGGTTTTPTIDEPGIYTITITDANTGCVASESLEVFIDTVAPVANATVSQNIDCNNAQITIDGSGSTGNNLLYAWTGSGIVSGANTSSPIVNQGGNYTLTITDSDNGCQDITTVNVVVDTLVPVFTAGNDTTVNCGQTLVTLNVNSILGATYSWTGNGIVSGGNSNSVTVNTAGTYSITITGTNGCSATDAINVGFGTGPSASFTTDVNSGQVPLVVNTNNTSTGTDLTYEWDFGNGSTATTFNASTTYTTAGTYWIELIVTDSLGCKDTAMVEIDADKFPLDIPNGFTPNGDGINDVFQIVGIEQYPENMITIFNRWGELVFTAQPYTNNWDGISNNTQLRLTGDKVVDGTYYFVLELGEGLDTYHDYIELKSR